MEIIKLEDGSLALNFNGTEKELLNELTHNLLMKLGNENPQALMPRLFPEAILNEPDLDSEYRDMTAHQLKNSHWKAVEALELITSENEIPSHDVILVIKGLNIIRLELGELLNINDESESSLTPDSDQYREWIIFQYLGQILSQCVEELNTNF